MKLFPNYASKPYISIRILILSLFFSFFFLVSLILPKASYAEDCNKNTKKECHSVANQACWWYAGDTSNTQPKCVKNEVNMGSYCNIDRKNPPEQQVGGHCYKDGQNCLTGRSLCTPTNNSSHLIANFSFEDKSKTGIYIILTLQINGSKIWETSKEERKLDAIIEKNATYTLVPNFYNSSGKAISVTGKMSGCVSNNADINKPCTITTTKDLTFTFNYTIEGTTTKDFACNGFATGSTGNWNEYHCRKECSDKETESTVFKDRHQCSGSTPKCCTLKDWPKPPYEGYCAYEDGKTNVKGATYCEKHEKDASGDEWCRQTVDKGNNSLNFFKCVGADSGKGGTDTGKTSPTPAGPTPTPMPQCHDEKNDRKNFLCGTASKAELAGQKCTYTDKSKAFDSSCQAASGNTYCYECTVDSSGGIKNVCKENKEGKDQGDFEKYLEPRCGGEKYDYAKALKGEYKGPYSDVYKCSKGDATIEIQESDICTKAPWNLKTGAGTPTPTMSPLLLCPSDGNHACAQYSNCSDTASFPKAKAEGNTACTAANPVKPFCCTKSTGGTTTTPTTGAATSPSPTTSGGGGTGSCSDKSKLENKCACNPTTDTCSAGLDCVTDWTGSLKHCVNYSTGKYCPAKTDTTPTEAACTGGTPAGGGAATPTTAASTTDTAVACKNAVGTDMNGLAESSQDRNCTDAKAADNSSRCCKTNPKCRTAFGDTYTCKVLQNDRGGPYGNCSTIPLCNN